MADEFSTVSVMQSYRAWWEGTSMGKALENKEPPDVEEFFTFQRESAKRLKKMFLTEMRKYPAAITGSEFRAAAILVDRILGPRLLWDAHDAGVLEPGALTEVVTGVWSSAEYPLKELTRRQWRTLFHGAGYTIDGEEAPRPTESITLYRGSLETYRRGWSWTDDRKTAERFAYAGLRGRAEGDVWEADVPPEHLLGVSNDREESEHIVDTVGLTIRLSR